MEFKVEDFDKMMVRVMRLPLKFDIKDVEELKNYIEFYKDPAPLLKHQVIRYIALVYDKNSPLVHHIQDINKRKIKACELCDLPIHKKGHKAHDHLLGVLSCQDPIVNDMIIRYVRCFYSESYAQYIVLQDAYYNEMKKLQLGELKSMSLLEGIEDRLEKLKDRIFNNDRSVNLAVDFNRYIDEEELKLTPEKIAEMLEDGESVYKEI